ncbi:MAG: elongation factor P, partial [Bacteroidota bacterium]
IYTIVEFLHVKPGKGPAFIRTKLKSLSNGKVLDNTFPSGAKLDIVRVERKKYQYIYREGESYMMMDTETYEQIPIQKDQIPNAKFLKEEMHIEVLFNTADDTILSVDLPQFVNLEVTYTEPGVKGDTATNATKPATVETGAEVKVPLFINQGDKVRIDTSNGAYMERVKS